MQSDTIRLLLWGTLLALALLLWNAWNADHPSVAVKNQSHSIETVDSQPNITPQANNPPSLTQLENAAKVSEGKPIEVHTDVLDVFIHPTSGNLMDVKLLKYFQEKDTKKPISLLNIDPAHLYLADSNLLSSTFKHPLVYKSKQTVYQLDDHKNELRVTLSARDDNNLEIEKTFLFKKGSYLVDVSYAIHNASTQPFTGYLNERLIRKKVPAPNKGIFHINPFIGGAYSTPAHPFEKLTFEDMDKANLSQEVKSGWVAMLQLYFLSAWIPDKSQTLHFYSEDLGNDVYSIGMQSPSFSLAPNAHYVYHSGLYVGPAVAEVLHNIAPHLGLTVNYGWLWFISEWLFWLLKQIYNLIGNWGWAIVLLTVLIKLVFYHLSATSYRSMAKMRLLQPKLESLKKRYGEDRQKLMQETMALYKKESVNPMGGCLPILVQIPVFIALYWVLLESVELYQAPFILWIRDLSAPDPYYILPILMGVSMFVQQKLSPPPPDPTQEKVMLLMPVIFTVLFLYFPAGLVLYWVVNNVISILQQWYITKHYHPKKKRLKA